MAHIKGESQAQIRLEKKTKDTLGSGDSTWYVEQRHVLDPITFFDIVVRSENFDQYFFYVIVLLLLGIVLM